jgi:thioredoxin 1
MLKLMGDQPEQIFQVFSRVEISSTIHTARQLPLQAQAAKQPLMLKNFYLTTKVHLLRIRIWRISMATTNVTTASFDAEVLKSSIPVLVDFWAEWCGPCRAVGPILEEISNEHGSKLKIVKLNTDNESAIAIKYGITSIPAMYVFVNGEVVKTIVGARPKPAMLKELESFIA